jgi:hypothetical protein
MGVYNFLGINDNGFLPKISVKDKSTDKVIIWNKNYRLDNLSFKYYGKASFDWVIQLKNSSLGADEYDWPSGASIVIPYPLEASLNDINLYYERYKKIKR